MGFISSSSNLFQQREVIVSRDGRGLEIMSDDGYRDFIIGGNDHGPQNTLLHVRAVASFLARKAKPRSQKNISRSLQGMGVIRGILTPLWRWNAFQSLRSGERPSCLPQVGTLPRRAPAPRPRYPQRF